MFFFVGWGGVGGKVKIVYNDLLLLVLDFCFKTVKKKTFQGAQIQINCRYVCNKTNFNPTVYDFLLERLWLRTLFFLLVQCRWYMASQITQSHYKSGEV